jgi:O-acetyl-ADP-ribose deacetylase (regulator of RNase III)
VDGAIHRAAGPRLLDECRALGGCATGQAKITKGYRLPAKHVIHTVGPVWSGGKRGEPEFLASCYRESLKLAGANGLKSIAFPAISCGVYGYPLGEAVRVAVRECAGFVAANPLPEKIIFACFDGAALAVYEAELAAL